MQEVYRVWLLHHTEINDLLYILRDVSQIIKRISPVLSVLLIDDEPALLETIKIMSERSRDMAVETAQSAKEGLKILQDKAFDTIIVDYDMPDITGIEDHPI
jgi:PleD family two-component response regulator